MPRPRPPFPTAALPADAGEPSKSRLKRASHDLQSLGEQLAALPPDRLATMPLPEDLRDAIAEHQRIRSHEARRRQMQYIGKLMRRLDDAPLRQALADATLGSAREALLLHEAERWREDLLAADDAVERWLQRHPDTDAQRLRNLVRAAREQAARPADQRNPRSVRELFRFIRPHLAARVT